MNDKVYIDGGIAIETPFFKYKKAGAKYDAPPEGAEILIPNTVINDERCLVIREEEKNGKIYVNAPSFFKEYYTRTWFSTRCCLAPFFSNTIMDCFSSFYNRRDEVISLLENNDVNISTRQTLYRLSIVSLVAAIDTLISDLILFVATKDRNIFLKAIDLAVPSTSKGKIMKSIVQMWCDNKVDTAEQEVIDYVLCKSYTDLDTIQKSLKLLYDTQIENDPQIKEILHLRNLIAHRNGRRKDGTFIEFNSSEIFYYIDHISRFADHIKLKLLSSDILKKTINDN